jgi:lambda repressor-like predicted transcriptional regulator
MMEIMFSKAKIGMLLGAMATALSIGSIGNVYAAADNQQPVDKGVKFEHKGWFNAEKLGKGKVFVKGPSLWENDELLDLLKLDKEQLQSKLKDGKSLADVAKELGVSTDELVSLLTKQEEERLAAAVKEGKLTEEQADKLKENIAERVQHFVENTHPGKGFVKFRALFPGFGDNEELLDLLKLDKEQLQSKLKDGKSLADVAKEQGVSTDELVSLLTKQEEERLAAAVKEGKLTQEQADKLKENIAERVKHFVENTHPGKGFVKFRALFPGFGDNEELLDLLKLDKEQLQSKLKDGKSLADVAKEQGVSTDELVSLLTKQEEERLAAAVKEGKLTQEQADKLKENIAERVKHFVENTHPGKGFVKFRALFPGFGDNEELLDLLKLDKEQLQSELKDGKSLADVAKEQGVSTDELVSLLTKQEEERLAAAVKEGKLTQEQADKRKAEIENVVKKLIERTFPAGHAEKTVVEQ